jgi:hypothetical protein
MPDAVLLGAEWRSPTLRAPTLKCEVREVNLAKENIMAKAASESAGNGGGNSNNKPVHEVRHRNLRATIWRNTTGDGRPMYNVTVSRSYRDDKGDWHDSTSFGFGELMNLAKALYDAHSFIAALIAKERREPDDSGGNARAPVAPAATRPASQRSPR